jgi:hypothetical protein
MPVGAYRDDEAPVRDGAPEVGDPGADGAVPERLERRSHGQICSPAAVDCNHQFTSESIARTAARN